MEANKKIQLIGSRYAEIVWHSKQFIRITRNFDTLSEEDVK